MDCGAGVDASAAVAFDFNAARTCDVAASSSDVLMSAATGGDSSGGEPNVNPLAVKIEPPKDTLGVCVQANGSVLLEPMKPICGKCGEVVDVDDAYPIKGMRFKCKVCNTRCTQLSNICGSWPSQEFKGLNELEQQMFYQQAKGKSTKKELEAFIVDTYARKKISSKSVGKQGEFLPLSVWAQRGYDPERIRNFSKAEDVDTDPQQGLTYRVCIKVTTDMETEEDTRMQLIQRKTELCAARQAKKDDKPPLMIKDASSSASSSGDHNKKKKKKKKTSKRQLMIKDEDNKTKKNTMLLKKKADQEEKARKVAEEKIAKKHPTDIHREISKMRMKVTPCDLEFGTSLEQQVHCQRARVPPQILR